MHHWPDKDDRSVVTEMLKDHQSPAWKECRDFLLKKCIKKGYPELIREDIVQETIIKVLRYLATFAYQYPLVVWLGIVLTTTAIDFDRKERKGKANVSLDALQDGDGEGLEVAIETRTPEDESIIHEKLHEAKIGYWAWLTGKSSKTAKRDLEIMDRYYVQGQSVRQIAHDLQIKEATVRHVLRKAKRYFSQFHCKD